MAEVILSPLLKGVFGSLISMIQNEVDLFCGIKQELDDLSSTLSTIRDVLEDAEEKQVKEKSVRNWLKKLKDVAYEVDNVLDEYATEALQWKLAEHTTDSWNMQVSNFFKKPFFRLSIGHSIRKINDRLSKIAEERLKFHLREGISEKKIENRETHSFVDEKTVLGRESEKKKIVDLLLSSDDRVDVFVIPIVGLGGLGKTTLAQFVYNDKQIKKHFQPRMWVCVSEDFDIKRLIKAIIEAKEKSCQLEGLDLLQDHLSKMLRGKRFLLVLEDVWNEDQSKWESLMNLLRGGEKGSRIIVTTRSEKVSPIMVRTTTIHLECLSDDDCWPLFAQRAYSVRIEEVHPNMIAIGKEIVKKCKGVPLAAKSLGSLMHFKREESEWEEIRDNETLDLLNDESGILNALRISYDNLPTYLKQCFTYCCVYPKDYKIKKEELIRLWMAQGFIQPSTGNSRQLEDIGSDYFNDLVWRSFFQDEERDIYGDITYKMHDLMHDLAQSIAKDECRSIQNGKAEEVIEHNKPYHLSLVNDGPLVPQTIPEILYKCSYLRTLLVFKPSRGFRVEVLDELFLKLRCLRVLDLSYCDIRKLPDSIGNLKHLRYLNLRDNYFIQSLPETTCNLWNLQTLDIRNCKISKLPERMKNMVSLRHLEMDDVRIKYMPSGIGRLTCLQTLRVYRVGEAESEFGGLGELQHLINLRGELAIKELGNAKDIEEAEKANLRGKQHLHTLELCWADGSRGNNNAQEVLEALEPHTNLRHLTIYNYGGSKFPSWMGNSSFTNLVCIFLHDFLSISCECLPSFGKLRLLKELIIGRVHGVKYFSTADGSNYDEENTLGFPSLEYLLVNEMPDLEDWSTSGQGNLSCLRKLDIRKCPKLRALPKLPSLERLDLYEMPWSTSGEEKLSFLLELDIRNCPKLRALPKLQSLKKLKLDDMPDLEDLSAGLEENLSFLLELDINKCQKLRALPKLQSLKKLKLDDMPNLQDLSTSGEGNLLARFVSRCRRKFKFPDLQDLSTSLSRLCELTIRKCPKLRALPRLPSLEKLELDKMPDLKNWSAIEEGNLRCVCELRFRNCSNLRRALPNLKILTLSSRDDEIPLTWEHLPSLESLSIMSCVNITSLPDSIENLCVLKKLKIDNCPKLGSLPEGLKHLHALEELNIKKCPLLTERCKEGGEDWPNITHIASIEIDLMLIRPGRFIK